MKPYIFLLLVSSFFFFIGVTTSQSIFVKNDLELKKAIQNAKPGAKIVLANGRWKDIEIDFKGKGEKDKVISMVAQDNGKVFIEGKSSLTLSGSYLFVKGLVFRNGFTPVSEAISFRRSKTEPCNNCRVTECVIDNFNNPERFDDDLWVAIYGKNNRFDHNQISGKRNQGVTLAVRLDSELSRENNHQIDHNYFGPRPVLGSNGGETIRIGTSPYSLSNSKSLVEDNYFDRCNGEHEIISNKSCQNTYRNNTFFECQGTLTMRHGNETLVENNYFFGNGKANTGGIRIINERQTVRNNYCDGLTGYRFRGALVIMNGVPNSPINRYTPVVDSKATNNTFVNCDYIQFCAGSDAERSAPPKRTLISKNIFYNSEKNDIFTIYDDISGISFDGNYASSNIELFNDKGFVKKDNILEPSHGIYQPKAGIDAGAILKNPENRPSKQNTGVTWYPKHEEDVFFHTGRTINISPSKGDLYDAVRSAAPGDIIMMSPGEYTIKKSIDVLVPLTISGNGSKGDIKIYFERSTLFNIENKGSLELKNLWISGRDAPDKSGNSMIRTSRYSMINNYKLIAENCEFTNLKVNNSFNFLDIYKNTFADTISFKYCRFSDISGSVFSFDKEYEDLGIYNVENMIIEGCSFENVNGEAINLYRGGGDESTFGPSLTVSSSKFKNVGNGSKNKSNSAVKIYGVQFASFTDNVFEKSKAIDMFLTVGDPVIMFSNTTFIESEKIKSNSDKYSFTTKTASNK